MHDLKNRSCHWTKRYIYSWFGLSRDKNNLSRIFQHLKTICHAAKHALKKGLKCSRMHPPKPRPPRIGHRMLPRQTQPSSWKSLDLLTCNFSLQQPLLIDTLSSADICIYFQKFVIAPSLYSEIMTLAIFCVEESVCENKKGAPNFVATKHKRCANPSKVSNLDLRILLPNTQFAFRWLHQEINLEETELSRWQNKTLYVRCKLIWASY